MHFGMNVDVDEAGLCQAGRQNWVYGFATGIFSLSPSSRIPWNFKYVYVCAGSIAMLTVEHVQMKFLCLLRNSS